jgi:hypothetical protein
MERRHLDAGASQSVKGLRVDYPRSHYTLDPSLRLKNGFGRDDVRGAGLCQRSWRLLEILSMPVYLTAGTRSFDCVVVRCREQQLRSG